MPRRTAWHIYRTADYIPEVTNQKTLKDHGIKTHKNTHITVWTKASQKMQYYEDKNQSTPWKWKYRNKSFSQEAVLPLHITLVCILKCYSQLSSARIKNRPWKKDNMNDKSCNNNVGTNKQWARHTRLYEAKMKWQHPEQSSFEKILLSIEKIPPEDNKLSNALKSNIKT